MKNEVFGGSGPPLGRGLKQKRPKGAFSREKGVLFGRYVGAFSVVWQTYFRVYFHALSFSALWAVLRPQGVQKGDFGKYLWCHFGGSAKR